jgi:hypothetical protein
MGVRKLVMAFEGRATMRSLRSVMNSIFGLFSFHHSRDPESAGILKSQLVLGYDKEALFAQQD